MKHIDHQYGLLAIIPNLSSYYNVCYKVRLLRPLMVSRAHGRDCHMY